MNKKLIGENISLNNGAIEENINKIKKYFGEILPESYIKLLEFSDGISTDEGLLIFNSDSIIERNETYEVATYAQGYVAIGSDGGDILFLMTASEENKIITVGCGDLCIKSGKCINKSLIDFIYEYDIENDFEENNFDNDFCSIVLCQKPESGLKGLLELKKVLEIDSSAKELLELCNNLPAVIKKDIRIAAGKYYLDKLSHYKDILIIK